VVELCWQLFQAGELERLSERLSDLRIFHKLYPVHRFDLYKYWRSIEQKTSLSTVDSYLTSLERGDTFPLGEIIDNIFLQSCNFLSDVIKGDSFATVATFLENFAKYDGAREVYLRAKR